MSTQPADIANQVLDAIGHVIDKRIGDLQEGSDEAKILLRHYGPCLRQLHRAAHWNFARKRAPLRLLNDATGQTTKAQISAGLPPTVGTGTPGMRPWAYEYALPIDCAKARFVPASHHAGGPGAPAGNIALPVTPLTGATTPGAAHSRVIPTRFLLTNDAIPNLVGQPESWTAIPDTSQTMNQGLTSQTVLLSDQRHAELVYTALITYPDQWDPLFRQAYVGMLGSFVAFAVIADKKLAFQVRAQQIAVAKDALAQARISDGNEEWGQADISVDWMRARNSGGWGRGGWAGGGGDGVLGYGWDSVGMGDGNVY